MNKRCINTMFVLLGGIASVAYADGPVEDYDHSSPAVARTLSPGEYLVNADGAQEDPEHRMSDVARAYRNGLIAGRKEAAAKQQAGSVPPLPPDMQSVAVKPPLVSHRYVYAERPTAPTVPAEQEVVQYQQPQQRLAPAPMQYIAQQNVYTQRPSYAEPQEYAVESYAPPPPVYVQPEPRYVVVQRPPRRMWAPPMGYWQGGGYYPPEPMGRPYAYQPY